MTEKKKPEVKPRPPRAADAVEPVERREANYKPGKISEAHRERIQVAKLLDILHEHAMGKKKLTITRLKAIEILLKKKLPDLGVETNKGEVAPVTFIFGQAPSPTHPPLAAGALPSSVVAGGGATGQDAVAVANPFVIAPSKPPEADTTKH